MPESAIELVEKVKASGGLDESEMESGSGTGHSRRFSLQ